MAYYRKIDPRIWTDTKFRKLSNDSKYMFLYLLTSPHSTAWGAYVINDLYIQADIEYNPKQIKKCWDELKKIGLVLRCEKTFLVCLPNWFKFNCPVNKKSKMACLNGILSLQGCEALTRYCEESEWINYELANSNLTMPEQLVGEIEKEIEKEIEIEQPKPKKQNGKFKPPLLEEVVSYFKEKGYTSESGQKAFEFYSVADWYDSRGNKVKNWKQKMLANWLVPENKIKQPTGDELNFNLKAKASDFDN